jgi:ABC-type microcin C transport system duplicated ATPase subunit YejF
MVLLEGPFLRLSGKTAQVFAAPQEEYTRTLTGAEPSTPLTFTGHRAHRTGGNIARRP